MSVPGSPVFQYMRVILKKMAGKTALSLCSSLCDNALKEPGTVLGEEEVVV